VLDKSLFPVRVLFRLAGSPALPGFSSSSGPVPTCHICGLPAPRSAPWRDWLPPSATDWDLWHGPGGPNAVVCEPCAWVRSGKPGSPECLRLEAHVCSRRVDSEWTWLRFLKRDVAEVLAALLVCLELPSGSSWFAAVPTSGRKHVIPRASVNVVRQTAALVVFETELAALTLDGSHWTTLAPVRELLALGFTKDEILTGRYDSRRIAKAGLDRWRPLEERVRVIRGRAELELALHLEVKS